jgi:hypothetical protein
VTCWRHSYECKITLEACAERCEALLTLDDFLTQDDRVYVAVVQTIAQLLDAGSDLVELHILSPAG